MLHTESMLRRNQHSVSSLPRSFTDFEKVGFNRATRRNPCPICGAKKYCQTTRDGRLAHCMKRAAGSVKQAKDGGYIHLLAADPLTSADELKHSRRANEIKRTFMPTAMPLAPIEIRDAAYRTLIELSPAFRYECELITAHPDGLLARGLASADAMRFGAFPPRAAERDALAEIINLFLSERFPQNTTETNRPVCLGVPGFWQHPNGRIKLGRDYDFKHPALIIPYRNEQGLIQACQLRFAGRRGGYHWLSTAEDQLEREPFGTSSGSPIHWTAPPVETVSCKKLPILVTEGALKAEVFVSLRPPIRAIATAGVGVAHAEIVSALRGCDAIIGFDSDHRMNAQVCRQLGKLIAEREQDRIAKKLKYSTSIVTWEGVKGIDEAAFQNVQLHVTGISAWLETLSQASLSEVKEVWKSMSFTSLPSKH